MLTLNTWYSIG